MLKVSIIIVEWDIFRWHAYLSQCHIDLDKRSVSQIPVGGRVVDPQDGCHGCPPYLHFAHIHLLIATISTHSPDKFCQSAS